MIVTAIKFWAPWCGPCKTLSTVLKDVELENINIDEDTEGLATKHKIRSIPTIVFINQEGEEIQRKTGIITRDEYYETLKSLEIGGE